MTRASEVEQSQWKLAVWYHVDVKAAILRDRYSAVVKKKKDRQMLDPFMHALTHTYLSSFPQPTHTEVLGLSI